MGLRHNIVEIREAVQRVACGKLNVRETVWDGDRLMGSKLVRSLVPNAGVTHGAQGDSSLFLAVRYARSQTLCRSDGSKEVWEISNILDSLFSVVFVLLFCRFTAGSVLPLRGTSTLIEAIFYRVMYKGSRAGGVRRERGGGAKEGR